MTIEDFVVKAKHKDKRNVFDVYEGEDSFVPNDMREFYHIANPIDVELDSKKLGSVKFYQISELQELNREYDYLATDIFVFATIDSDPIFYKQGLFYKSYKGKYGEEFIADSLEEFLIICVN